MNSQRDASSFRLKKSISLQQTGFTTSPRHRGQLWALTPLFSPLPSQQPKRMRGGIVSVALSLGLPPVAVSDCPSLCCPDFPRTNTRLVDNLTTYYYITPVGHWLYDRP